MTNNQDDLNRLINEFTIQKQKDRKHYLRIEIAKANDRSVKRALQDILDDIEKKERRNRIVGIVVLIVILLIGFYILGVRDDNRNNGIIKKTSTSTLQSVEESSTDEVIEEVVKEKNLSEDEVKQWVAAVWQKRYQKIADMPEVNFHVHINDSDNLVYINVAPPQTDVVDVFRINANGELEESGRFITTANYNDWIVISKKFLDTSQVQVKEPTMTSSEVEVTNLTAKEFAEYYAKCYKITYPIMSIEEYTEKYGHIKEYDDSIQIITYTDYSSVENSVQCGIITPYRTAESFYIYDNSDKKAYLIRNNASGETEFIPELTDYISNSR